MGFSRVFEKSLCLLLATLVSLPPSAMAGEPSTRPAEAPKNGAYDPTLLDYQRRFQAPEAKDFEQYRDQASDAAGIFNLMSSGMRPAASGGPEIPPDILHSFESFRASVALVGRNGMRNNDSLHALANQTAAKTEKERRKMSDALTDPNDRRISEKITQAGKIRDNVQKYLLNNDPKITPEMKWGVFRRYLEDVVNPIDDLVRFLHISYPDGRAYVGGNASLIMAIPRSMIKGENERATLMLSGYVASEGKYPGSQMCVMEVDSTARLATDLRAIMLAINQSQNGTKDMNADMYLHGLRLMSLQMLLSQLEYYKKLAGTSEDVELPDGCMKRFQMDEATKIHFKDDPVTTQNARIDELLERMSVIPPTNQADPDPEKEVARQRRYAYYMQTVSPSVVESGFRGVLPFAQRRRAERAANYYGKVAEGPAFDDFTQFDDVMPRLDPVMEKAVHSELSPYFGRQDLRDAATEDRVMADLREITAVRHDLHTSDYFEKSRRTIFARELYAVERAVNLPSTSGKPEYRNPLQQTNPSEILNGYGRRDPIAEADRLKAMGAQRAQAYFANIQSDARTYGAPDPLKGFRRGPEHDALILETNDPIPPWFEGTVYRLPPRKDIDPSQDQIPVQVFTVKTMKGEIPIAPGQGIRVDQNGMPEGMFSVSTPQTGNGVPSSLNYDLIRLIDGMPIYDRHRVATVLRAELKAGTNQADKLADRISGLGWNDPQLVPPAVSERLRRQTIDYSIMPHLDSSDDWVKSALGDLSEYLQDRTSYRKLLEKMESTSAGRRLLEKYGQGNATLGLAVIRGKLRTYARPGPASTDYSPLRPVPRESAEFRALYNDLREIWKSADLPSKRANAWDYLSGQISGQVANPWAMIALGVEVERERKNQSPHARSEINGFEAGVTTLGLGKGKAFSPMHGNRVALPEAQFRDAWREAVREEDARFGYLLNAPVNWHTMGQANAWRGYENARATYAAQKNRYDSVQRDPVQSMLD
ncbi:MAG: hypothetical protein AB7P04_12565, partial [Bacteriovoracia bacterium]